jgi:hypothetical protein
VDKNNGHVAKQPDSVESYEMNERAFSYTAACLATDVMIFKIFFAEKLGGKMGVFDSKQS